MSRLLGAAHEQLRLPARDALLDQVEAAGLTGRGGAAFPTARKLRTVLAAGGRRGAVVVANGVDGEPGSEKDATLMARHPHLVLDGIALAAHAVDGRQSFLVLAEGSPALPALRRAQAERTGPTVVLRALPPGYVASQETALVSWLDGGRAVPTSRRPYEDGVGGRPTLVSNVETLAHLALISRHGAAWFREVGDPAAPGTALLTVIGPLGTRVVEAPTGTAIEHVLAAGGVEIDEVAAVLVGGASGRWVGASDLADLRLVCGGAGEGLAAGAGVLRVLGAGACGLAETSRWVSLLAQQSAGQCGPCLNGLPALAAACAALAFGPWQDASWADLQRWLVVVPGRGACRHPDGVVRTITSALEVFAGDVAHHRVHGPCGARVPAGAR